MSSTFPAPANVCETRWRSTKPPTDEKAARSKGGGLETSRITMAALPGLPRQSRTGNPHLDPRTREYQAITATHEKEIMSEQVVLVTGALAGIGRATATAFARDGASVVVSGRRDEEGKAEYIRADVAIEDDVRALVEGTVKIFGKLDAAVNNAGYTGAAGPLATQ